MENEQPSNKIDSITQFLTVHNTTIIAVIMAISAMLGQSYQQQEEAVHETQEDFEDKQADLKSIELMYGEHSAQYQNSAKEYQKEEVKLLEEAMEAINFDTSGLSAIPKAEGRLPQQTEGGYPQQEGAGQQAQGAAQQEGAGQPPQGAAQQEGAGQPPQGGTQQQPAQNAQPSSKVKDIGKKFKEVVETAKTQSAYSDYATTILQISVLLSSIGVSVVNRFLSYLASALTLVGVVLEILAATM